MAKTNFDPGTMLNPVPVVMVSCGEGDEANIITIAWAGTVCSNPPMLSISVMKKRHSHHIIEETGEFVVNLVNEDLVKACDYCGVTSGSKVNKWKDTGLTKGKADFVSCPTIEESPVNLECKVREMKTLGSHDIFIAEIVNVKVDDSLIDDKGKIWMEDAGFVAYNHGKYQPLKEPVGFFGFSVMKEKTRLRKEGK